MNRGKDCAFALQWADDTRAVVGDGISRTSDPRAVLWSAVIEFAVGPRLRATIKATSKAEARKFAKNRHPEATIITINGKEPTAK